MADPLSAISLGIQVAQGFVHYTQSFRGYDDDIDGFVSSVERLRENLQHIKDFLENPAYQSDKEARGIRAQLEKNLGKSGTALLDLDRKLQKLQPDSTKSGVRDAIKKLGRQAAWHFRKDSLPRLQATVTDTLSSLEFGINQYQLHQVGFMRKDLSEMKTQQNLEKIKSWVSAPNHSSKHKTARQRHLAGTASWIFDEPNYRDWVINPGVLWLTGTPGSGKTILSSEIIEKLKVEFNVQAGYKIAYFYFQQNDNVNGSAEMLTRSLIYQLSFTSTYCASEVERLYEICQNERESPTLEELISVIVELIRTFAGVFVVLDALDEAPEPTWLWQVLEALSTTEVHLLLVSRPNVEIRPEIQKVQSTGIQIDPDKVDGDIRKIVKTRLSTDEKLGLFSESHSKIESSLMKKAGGMFKLVVSQLDRLRKCRTTATMNAALESIPHDLYELWENCFTSIHQEDLADTVRLLTWLCFSQRPVRVDEAIDALAISKDWRQGFDLADYRLKDPQALLDMGSGLIEIDQNLTADSRMTKEATLHLAHASVKDFLQSGNASRKFSKRSPFTDSEGHGILAQLCLQYLLQFDKECEWTKRDLLEHPLAEYSAFYWRYHLSKSSFEKTSIDLACDLLLNVTTRTNWRRIMYRTETISEPKWRQIFVAGWPPVRHRGAPLTYAAEASLDVLVENLLRRDGVRVNDSGSWMSALEVAVEQDRLSTVDILVANGADVNIAPRYSSSMLSLACEYSSLNVIAYLLDHGATDSARNKIENPLTSALVTAASREDDAVIRLLLDRGHIADCSSSYRNRTALHEAATSLRLSNIQVLLNHGAKKGLKDRDGNSPLHLAVKQEACTLEIAKLLSFKGAEFVANRDGDTPFIASVSGNRSVCEMILRATPDLQISKPKIALALIKAATKGFLSIVQTLHQRHAGFSEGGKFAVIEAARNGHVDVVRYLLVHGQEIDVVDSNDMTPFLHAVENGQQEVWKLLVDHGAQVNTLDHFDRNACHLMVKRNHAEGLQWLLSRGVESDKRDKNGLTALHEAARLGRLEHLKILVEHGANMHATDNDDASVNHYAAANGHLVILQWLSEQGLPMNVVDKYGSTPFLDAGENGKLECVKFLSKFTRDHSSHRLANGATALAVAAGGGHLDVVKWMCENGSDVNEQFDLGGSVYEKGLCALLLAMGASKFNVTKYLLENGANPNHRTHHGTTPLLDAAEHRPMAYLNLLIEHGAQIKNVRDGDGDDALNLAIEDPDSEVLRWFVGHEVAHSAGNKYGFYPMLKAAMFNRVEGVKLLHHAKYTYSVPSQSDEKGNHENDIRKTSVWYAFRCLKSVYERLEVHDRFTPLMVSAFKGHSDVATYFLTEFPDMRMSVDQDGNDALTYACCAGKLELVDLLIEYEFDITRVNVAGRNVREETEHYLQCLNTDHLTEEDVTEKKLVKDMMSNIEDVLDHLRDLENKSGDKHRDDQSTTGHTALAYPKEEEENVVGNADHSDSVRQGNEINSLQRDGIVKKKGKSRTL